MKHIYSLFRMIPIALLLFTCIPFLNAGEDNDSWEVEIIAKKTDQVVKSEIVNTNSFLLDGLEYNVEYYAKIRTKNTFLSDWEVSDVFLLDAVSGTISIGTSDLLLRSDNGQLIIFSDIARQVDIYTVDGHLLRSVSLSMGETKAVGLAKGVFLINGQKIVVK